MEKYNSFASFSDLVLKKKKKKKKQLKNKNKTIICQPINYNAFIIPQK